MYAFDVEVYPNFFCVGLEDINNDKKYYYEISHRRDDWKYIKDFFDRYKGFLIGFNSIHYDNPIINFVREKKRSNKEIKDFSDFIISDKNEGWWRRNKELSKYKYNYTWQDIDLMLRWSKGLRINKKISLKGLAVQLSYPMIQELPYPHDKILTEDEMNEVAKYNYYNDLGITKRLFFNKEIQDELKVKKGIHDNYGIIGYSKDGPKIAEELLAKFYEEKTGDSSFRDKRTIREEVCLKDIILEKFKIGYTYYDMNLLDYLKPKCVRTSKELNIRLFSKNPDGSTLVSDVKSGGIHGVSFKNSIKESKGDTVLVDFDIKSQYPSCIVHNKFIPEHMGLPLVEIYDKVMQERFEAKASGDKMKSEAFKLILNSTFGKFGSEYSYLFDLKALLSVTINNQLFLLMSTETLQKNNINVVYQNTK